MSALTLEPSTDPRETMGHPKRNGFRDQVTYAMPIPSVVAWGPWEPPPSIIRVTDAHGRVHTFRSDDFFGRGTLFGLDRPPTWTWTGT